MLGKAIAYFDRHWAGLVRYCDDGGLEIDNNRCESAMRPFVTARKNWLFSDTVHGAKASAHLSSLIERRRWRMGWSLMAICAACSPSYRRRRRSRTSRRCYAGLSRIAGLLAIMGLVERLQSSGAIGLQLARYGISALCERFFLRRFRRYQKPRCNISKNRSLALSAT